MPDSFESSASMDSNAFFTPTFEMESVKFFFS